MSRILRSVSDKGFFLLYFHIRCALKICIKIFANSAFCTKHPLSREICIKFHLISFIRLKKNKTTILAWYCDTVFLDRLSFHPFYSTGKYSQLPYAYSQGVLLCINGMLHLCRRAC